jgi:hypothetical protein
VISLLPVPSFLPAEVSIQKSSRGLPAMLTIFIGTEPAGAALSLINRYDNSIIIIISDDNDDNDDNIITLYNSNDNSDK